jgi:hypothetical protein
MIDMLFDLVLSLIMVYWNIAFIWIISFVLWNGHGDRSPPPPPKPQQTYREITHINVMANLTGVSPLYSKEGSGSITTKY